jgi:hypothetical protein
VGEDRTGPYADQGPTGQPTRLAVADAAQALGISAEAVRMRIRRGTLPSERVGGSVHVLLDADQTRRDAERNDDVTTDRTERIADLKDQLGYLRGQLDAEREANRENRRIIAALTQRIPAIEAPSETPSQEPPEAPTAATEQPGRVDPQPSVEGAQEGAEQPQRRSWWREFFGF